MWKNFRVVTAANHQQVTQFTRHFTELLEAGIRVSDALQLIAGSPGNRFASKIASCLLADLNEGRSLGYAMDKHPEWFNAIYRQLATTGETTGQLPRLMRHLANYRIAGDAVTTRIKRAIVYPLLILLFSAVMLIGLLALVVPRFRDLFNDSGDSLPLLTRVVVQLSDVLVANWWIFFVLLLFILVVTPLLRRLTVVRLLLLRLTSVWPFIGSLQTMRQRELFLRSLALMIASRLSITESIDQLSANANLLWRGGLKNISEKLYQGQSLEKAMAASGLFAEADLFAARIGQQSARLDNILLQQADQYAKIIERRLHNLALLLEPCLMLFIGLIIALVVLAVYLPLFSIGQAL